MRLIKLESASFGLKPAPPELLKALPDESLRDAMRTTQENLATSAEVRPLVPPPPPWDQEGEGSALTSLVSEALRPLPELAVGVGIGVDEDELVELDVAELVEFTPTERLTTEPGAETMAEASAEEAGLVEIDVVEGLSDEPGDAARRLEEIELDIDLEDLSQRKIVPRRLLHYLRDRFIDAPERVDLALAAYRGKYASIHAYVREVINGETIADWLRPYLDIEALAQDWRRAGIIWAIDDPGGNGEEPGLHIFLS